MKIKKGETIILTKGEYSNYSILDARVALKDFDTKNVMTQHLKAHPKQKREYRFDMDVFIKWLNRKRLVKLLPLTEWHIQSYSTVDFNGKG